MGKKFKTRLIVISSVILIVLWIVMASLAGQAADVTVLETKRAELKFTETGMVKSEASVDVFALVPGEIKSVNVQEGQPVRKGDLIAVIDSSELQNQIRQLQAQSNSGAIGAQSSAQQIVINQRNSELERAAENEQKSLSLYQAGAISEAEYKTALTALETAKSALEGAYAQLDVIRSSSTSVQSQIDTLRKKIADCSIKAPIDGTVSTLNVKNTNIVTGSSPVARITAQEGKSEVEVFVSTKDISRVHPDDAVKVIFEDRAGDIVIDAIVENIDSRAQGVQSALGTTEYKVKVTIGFDSEILKEGYAVKIDFVYYRADDKLLVPKSAVFEENGQDKVFVVKDGKARKIVVEKGIELRTEYVIESGLNAGDVIIDDANTAGIKDGTRIKS